MGTIRYPHDATSILRASRIAIRILLSCLFPLADFSSAFLPPLAELTKRQLVDLVQEYKIRILELTCSDSELLAIVSLLPHETISACASKLKGRISKWLREKLELTNRTKLLSRSYFACTVGNSKAKVIERYLDKQSEHHEYAGRVWPPVFVKQYELTQRSEALLAPKHARVIARFHIVLSTQKRLGIIGSQEALRITSE